MIRTLQLIGADPLTSSDPNGVPSRNSLWISEG